MPALIRVGHKGADAIVSGNTLASFDAALAAGVDMIEFDVLAAHLDGSGELLVVHDYAILRRRKIVAPTLDEALEHLGGDPFSAVRLQVDLKRQCYEERVVDAIRAAGLVERSMISTAHWPSLGRVRAVEPALKLGWTVGDPIGFSATPVPSWTLGRLHRAWIAARATTGLGAGAIDALVPQWPLVTVGLVAAVTQAGGEIYPWTVDDATEIRRLAELGVTGVITNDPRLFAALS
jgi:glycerophosphoryl diester phosphodiesterase